MKIANKLFLFVLLFLSSVSPLHAQQYVSEGAWAVGLVRGLDWESKGIPAQPSLMDYFDLLSGRNFVNVDLKTYATRLGVMPETLTYNVNLAHSGRYRLIAYVYGNPVMFTVDEEPTASSAISNGWNFEDMGTLVLKRGVHRLSITVPRGSSIGAVYLSSLAVDAIQPKDGWVASKVLDYGTQASTMAMAMEAADKLPLKARIPTTIKTGANVREFMFQLPADPVINFSMLFASASKGYMMVDNSIVITYETSGGRTPLNLKTISLGPGQHIAYLKVLSGQPPYAFGIYQHNDSPDAYVALMRSMGYNVGFAYQPVPYYVARSLIGQLIARVVKKKPSEEIYLTGIEAKETELPSQMVLRTYKEPISPMIPFE